MFKQDDLWELSISIAGQSTTPVPSEMTNKTQQYSIVYVDLILSTCWFESLLISLHVYFISHIL